MCKNPGEKEQGKWKGTIIPIAQILCFFSISHLSKEHKFALTMLLIGYRKCFVEKYSSNYQIYQMFLISGFSQVSVLKTSAFSRFPLKLTGIICICWQAWTLPCRVLDAHWPSFTTHVLQDAHHSSSCSSSTPVNNTGPQCYDHVIVLLLDDISASPWALMLQLQSSAATRNNSYTHRQGRTHTKFLLAARAVLNL